MCLVASPISSFSVKALVVLVPLLVVLVSLSSPWTLWFPCQTNNGLRQGGAWERLRGVAARRSAAERRRCEAIAWCCEAVARCCGAIARCCGEIARCCGAIARLCGRQIWRRACASGGVAGDKFGGVRERVAALWAKHLAACVRERRSSGHRVSGLSFNCVGP